MPLNRPNLVLRRTAAAAVLAAALAVPLLPASPASGMQFSPRGHLVATARGIGHGHGLSQYGARGAAARGLSYQRILAFYYRHTNLATVRHKPAIRVLLSDFGSTTKVRPYRGLWVTHMTHALPYRGIARYRLVADSGRGLNLEQLRDGRHARWHVYRAGLPNRSAFHAPSARATRIYAPNASSNYYYGHLIANRSTTRGAHGVYTVDQVNIDHYVAGVAPREMPSSWPAAAVRAQAVAARTFGMYYVRHPRSASYDICDTTDCQFYGGRSYYDPQGNRVWVDDLAVANATAYRVLHYRGRPIFAQFGASDGGWTADGGQPYLAARRDPYDDAASGDPYLTQHRRVSLARLAGYFGFAKLTDIDMAGRDGHGTWGGRVGTVHLHGRNAHGKAMSITTSGANFGWALGYNTDWLHLSR